MLKTLFGILSVIILVGFATETCAQDERQIIQFSGIVVGEDSTSGVPGVHIYLPKNGRGTTTNPYGYFSIPVLEGDSLILSAIGYEKMQFIIPKRDNQKLTVIIGMKADTTYLPELEIFPYPTEELFKDAILSLNIPNQGDLDNMQRNMDALMLQKMYAYTGMGASANHNYYMSQQMATYNARFQPVSIPILDPFAWNRFIKSLRNKEKKK